MLLSQSTITMISVAIAALLLGSSSITAFSTCSTIPRAQRSVLYCSHQSIDNNQNDFLSVGRRPFINIFAASVVTAAAIPVISPTAALAAVEDTGSAATYAYRAGGLPSLRTLGLGLLQRYEGYVAAPANSRRNQVFITFDFPSDWLQLDKLGGGIQYVDQRNGDKLYVLRAPLPEGKTLSTVPKAFFAEAIFDPRGDIVRSGTVVEGGRTSKSTVLKDCSPVGEEDGASSSPPLPADCMERRRLLVKYDTVTGSGVQTVERRGLVDAYEVDGDAYMLMTSSNAVKFDAKGRERDTVEAIAESFRVTL